MFGLNRHQTDANIHCSLVVVEFVTSAVQLVLRTKKGEAKTCEQLPLHPHRRLLHSPLPPV